MWLLRFSCYLHKDFCLLFNATKICIAISGEIWIFLAPTSGEEPTWRFWTDLDIKRNTDWHYIFRNMIGYLIRRVLDKEQKWKHLIKSWRIFLDIPRWTKNKTKKRRNKDYCATNLQLATYILEISTSSSSNSTHL